MDGVRTPAAVPADVEEPGRLPSTPGANEARTMLDLPTDQPRRPQRSGTRGRVSLEVDFDLDGALAPAARETIVVAAFASLLHRYTNEEQVALGFVEGEESARVLRLDFAGPPSFEEAVERTQRSIDEAVTDVLPQAVVSLGARSRVDDTGDHELWLVAEPRVGGLGLLLDFDADLYETDTAERMLDQVRALLEAAITDPSTTVAELPLLGPRERSVVLEEWNETASAFPRSCVDVLVADQAARSPEAVAVECDGKSLTFAELDRRASRLAGHLRQLGVGPDVLVAIAMERSVELLVGLLGILKAGGAYVPIDPSYPVDRQSYMLQDADVGVLVTQEGLLDRVPFGSARPVCLDRDWDEVERSPEPGRPIERDAEQLAYVIYTSGSTGRPKGVEIPHRALANFLWTMRQRPGLSETDVLVAVTTLSFDIAGLELFLPLIVGGRVVIAPQGTSGDPRLLSALLAESSATVMQATPTTWRMLLDSGWRGRPGLKALCGGEALPVSLAEELVACGIELWNMYGPTETTIWSTVAPVRPGEPLTIGRPIGNTTLFILDSRLQPLPAGVAGELHIGGDGVARGYRNRPDLTAERFVANPFGPGRLYKTGDLARYRRDGTVEYLGRLDHQVKIRGFRIELGEIETLLSRNDGVAGAVCVARDDGGGPELVAYFVPSGVPVSSAGLRRYLSEHLPSYMVPSAIVSLADFPLTPNGKIDRKALPAPTRERMAEEAVVPPRTELERRLAEIWERVLGVSPIGVTDNFFDLGTTSIVAAQLFARIEHELGEALPLGAVFRAPTIETLADLIESREGGSRRTSLVPIQPHGTRPPVFCVHGGAGTILHLEPLARRLGEDQPFYALQARGLYGGAPPLRTVEEMATHYLSEIRQVQAEGPYAFAGYCFGALVAFEMAQRVLAEGEEVRLLASFNGPSPTWLRRWGWFGNQRSFRGPMEAPLPFRGRLRRALREPSRFRTAFRYHASRRLRRLQIRAADLRAGVALSRGRPLPEGLREAYFLRLHGRAERAYDPEPYPGTILLVYGEGLYEDPLLGWDGLALGGVEAHAAPGAHTNNRQLMAEPHVEFVRELLVGGLDRRPAGL
jgi:amino acid adenylation domain-containing protein